MFLFLLEPDVTVNLDEAAQLFRIHFVVALLRRVIGALDAVQRDAAGTQHALYFGEHRIFLFRFDVAQHVETDDVIEAGVSERQTGEFGAEGCVVTIAPRGQRAFIGQIDTGERHSFALQQREHAGAATKLEHFRTGAHVVVNPHRAREANVETIECFEVTGIEHLVGNELGAIKLGDVGYAGALV